MDDLRYRMMLAFQDELEKQAISLPPALGRAGSFLRQQAGAAGAGMGVGALGGGLLGAGVQGARGYQQAREQGATTGQALLAGAGKGVGGALTGAAVGAGLGGAAGLAGGARARELASRAVQGGTWNPVASSARFGQRQLHSLTGYADAAKPEGLQQLRAMRGGAYGAQERAIDARKRLSDMMAKPGADPEAVRKATQDVQKAQKGLGYAERAEQMGLTSAPGYLKSLATRPLETLRTGFGEQWHGSGLAGKATVVGLPAVATAGEAISPTKEGGPGRAERVGRSAASSLMYGAAPIPLAGMSLLGMGAERLGGLLGSGVDAAFRRRAVQEVGQ